MKFKNGLNTRLLLLLGFVFFIGGNAEGGIVNSAHNANCCSVWISGKNPTWLFSFEKAEGGVVTTCRQPYNSSTNIAGTHPENGGLGVCEVSAFEGWAGNHSDATPSFVVIESTTTRFRLYIQADLIDHTGPGQGEDRGTVYDTISIYWNRIVYNRRIFPSGTTNSSGWRPMVWAFMQSAVEDSLIFADDDEIDILGGIAHSGNLPLPIAQDTVHAQEMFMANNDTTCSSIFFRTLYEKQINGYVSHDASDRRGSGFGTYANTTGAGQVTYEGKFLYWWGIFDHGGDSLQDRFIEYMNPCGLTVGYGSGNGWAETKGCYIITDGGGDSVKFTFDRGSWPASNDSTVFNPVIEVASWDGGMPDSILVNNVRKYIDTDYYADTVDAKNFLIIHYHANLTADTEFIISENVGSIHGVQYLARKKAAQKLVKQGTPQLLFEGQGQ